MTRRAGRATTLCYTANHSPFKRGSSSIAFQDTRREACVRTAGALQGCEQSVWHGQAPLARVLWHRLLACNPPGKPPAPQIPPEPAKPSPGPGAIGVSPVRLSPAAGSTARTNPICRNVRPVWSAQRTLLGSRNKEDGDSALKQHANAPDVLPPAGPTQRGLFIRRRAI